ncbi:angiomotin-like 2a [Electrophorus electricus]|uniref:Angiomotin C-terminal domain-containing protein n=1 Tax=Electrophorus electricus TaxID=8005 RepID=A0A4W4EHG1_ELEEL|nr:angiomotin-like 2a [Electrophorus electricus]XP_026863507.2 angiomotin-like 2a [Electrophorus electricus]XP_026863508.2 angiomotin-like 2a [Electrophorus electricus]XP_026863509.2 angiomotin-like 2a [Electrophorus electricus]
MRTAEDSSGTVLHRLIQEQLRYGNPTDARTLLAIQQQALRGGSSGWVTGSPRSSLESLTQEESQFLQMSTRQEPQGQEHQGDCPHSESPVCHLYQLHTEELPTYEEAKAHSQYLASQRGHAGQQQGDPETPELEQDPGTWDLKREHARSLSERLMQLSLERNSVHDSAPMTSSHSYPQLSGGHAGAAAHGGSEQRGPPPEYPFAVKAPGYMLSHSQENGHYIKEVPLALYSQLHRYVPAQPQAARHNTLPALPPAGQEVIVGGYSIPAPNPQIEQLMKENDRLKREVESYSEKAARLQKLEKEIQRISEAYETLMKGSAKRETLEKTMRSKLESEIKRLHDFNRDLRDRLETANKQRAVMEEQDHSKQAFAKLAEQNEEHQQAREHLEGELKRLRASAEDWCRRREALEQALVSAQARNRQLEEDLCKKRAYVAKVEKLQSALTQLQAACEKREALELRLRTRLEQELKSLRTQQWQCQGQQVGGASLPTQSMSPLQQRLREREERILALEADITRWEQKYLEESTMRQFAMDAAATAAAQRDTTIIKHSPGHSPDNSFNEDLPSSSHRHREMENRIRALYAKLLEKDAVIKVLQQRSRKEQGRPEPVRLRPARSVPSISAASVVVRPKGKSLSDDQTAATPLFSAACLPPQAPNRDRSTQCDEPSDETSAEPEPAAGPAAPERGPVPSSDATAELLQTQTPPSTDRSTNGGANDLVEILI